ncbi:MAG: hypothetical protein IJE10_11170 [Clostridia bacterium]|nr:hypothetical protein [Clostridia bacterium]
MIKCSFMDNQEVGADDLNGLVKTLIGFSGVAEPFSDGDSYYVSKLNDICYNNIGEGVLPDTDNSLQVSVVGSIAHVKPGKAIFANGMIAEVTGTETVAITSGVKNYVALCANTKLNTCKVVAATASFSDSTDDGLFYVPLAEISASGVLTNKRKYAKSTNVASKYASSWGLPGYAKLKITENVGAFQLSLKVGSYNQMFIYVYDEDESARSLLKLDLNDYSQFYASVGTVHAGGAEVVEVRQGTSFVLCQGSEGGNGYSVSATIGEKDGLYNLKLNCYYQTEKAKEYAMKQTIEIFAV